MTRIAIVGAGHIGGNLARLFTAAGHAATGSFATDQDKLNALAAHIGAAADDPATAADGAAAQADRLIDDAGFARVRTGTLARTDAGHQEPKGDLYGEEFHREDAVAAVARLRGTPPSGRGRP